MNIFSKHAKSIPVGEPENISVGKPENIKIFMENRKTTQIGEPENSSVGKPNNIFKIFYGEPKNSSVGKLGEHIHVLYIFHVLHVLQTNSMFFNPGLQSSQLTNGPVLKGTMNCSQPELLVHKILHLRKPFVI